MRLRRRDDEPDHARFLMREKLLAIGDDFWIENDQGERAYKVCLLYTSPSPRDGLLSRMPSSA